MALNQPANAPTARAIAAAESWARLAKQPPGESPEAILENARRNNMDAASLESLQAHLRREWERGQIWIDPDIAAPCRAFQAITAYSLWRYYPMGGVAGFDWQQIHFHPGKPDLPAEEWPLVAAMERAAVAVLNEGKS